VTRLLKWMTSVPGVGLALAPLRAVPKALLLLFAPGVGPGFAISWPCIGFDVAIVGSGTVVTMPRAASPGRWPIGAG